MHAQEQFKSILDEKEKDVRQLQDERRRLATELGRTQQALENQRSLATDKDEFVRSLQLREVELNDKLMQAMNSQEQLHSRLKQDATGNQRLEEERKQAEGELQRMQQLLESERAQTRAKDETIRQLQHREMELDRQLSETWHDQEQLESQLDELIAGKRKIDEELQVRQQQLEQAAQTIANLETGRGTLESLLQECSDLHARLDTELSRSSDLNASVDLYKGRAEEYLRKVEQAEVAAMKASRAEQFAKTQVKEAEGTCASIIAERKQKDDAIEKLQRQNQQFEARLEDMAADLNGAVQAKKRLQNELEDYRSHRALDIEDKEKSTEQTRRKYQRELSTVTKELEKQRESVVEVRTENIRLREELEHLRTKWDDEVVNSSTWAKEKSRLEVTLHEVSISRDGAIAAHEEAQGKVASLFSQIRTLQASIEDITAERDALLKDKRGMRARLNEAGERLEELAGGESPSVRNAVGVDRELGRLKSSLAQTEDVAAAAVDKMRRAEALAVELQKDITVEREANSQLHKEKANLEKLTKELQLKLVDLETKSYSSASHDVKFLHGRILESQRSMRNVDRTVRDLHSQIDRRNQMNAQLTDDISKCRERIERLLQTVDELQASDSSHQLQARRAERELHEEKEKSSRLERELEGWKSLRKERGSVVRNGAPTSGPGPDRAWSDDGSRNARSRGPPTIPQRKASNTKGFL
ncbi:MAG: hypothetical protein M1826_007694 [Phylliscum demangeonii]|nr:MAG: hypothetical protein M1826_007694 [Phylliscum demangeonii]